MNTGYYRFANYVNEDGDTVSVMIMQSDGKSYWKTASGKTVYSSLNELMEQEKLT